MNINGDLVSTTICKQVIFLQKSAKLAGVQEYTPRTEPVQKFAKTYDMLCGKHLDLEFGSNTLTTVSHCIIHMFNISLHVRPNSERIKILTKAQGTQESAYKGYNTQDMQDIAVQ